MSSIPKNEQSQSFHIGSEERNILMERLTFLENSVSDIPLFIEGNEVFTEEKKNIYRPDKKNHLLARHAWASTQDIHAAIEACLEAKSLWETMPTEERCSIFLKAADLVAGKYRFDMIATTMLGQSKNVQQTEADAVIQLADILRFNVHYYKEILSEQPASVTGVYNSLLYRPLEGFVVAISPFNFTAIGGNLPTAPAICGNVVIWKPADTQILSAHLFMKILLEAGLPKGVINLIYTDGPLLGDVVFANKDFAGLHFTGSTQIFKQLWKTIGSNVDRYKNYPRIVGETGGKGFVVAHASSNIQKLNAALVRGAFEFQGQKCSAASRLFVSKSIWTELKELLIQTLNEIKTGSVTDLTCFMNAVIDQRAFNKIKSYIDFGLQDPNTVCLVGGKCDDVHGYFIQPTLFEVFDLNNKLLKEEIFGPVLTVFVFEDDQWESILSHVEDTSEYGLTGAIFAEDTNILEGARAILKNSTGNLYINDKPTGGIIGQQPFGGSRASGTNDKAGSKLNLYRWLSPQTIKDVANAPEDYKYPFMHT
ncbi:MAG: L-glutamate gamma-semialdehyde dehydrogenase [Leadbetterella sp.]